MGLFEDELQRSAQRRAQLDAQEQAQRAQDEYNARLAAANAQAHQAQNAAPGGLAGVLAGIGNSIKNVGDTLYNIGGTGIASIRDIMTGNAGTGKYQKEWKEYAKENIYGNKDLSDKDYYAKTGGKALDAAATVSDFIPGLGAGAKVALNVGQGVTSGVAQNYIDNGANVSLEDNLKSALVGGASAGVGQAVGGKLAKGVGGNGRIAKAINSNLGRGALTGAASGATGAGLSTALNGGGLGEVLGSAAQGAGGGALGGAAMAGTMGLAGTGIEKLKNKVLGVEPEARIAKTPMAQQTVPEADKATATGWGEKDMTGAAKKRNNLQKLGDTLKETGQMTEDSGVYGKLKGNTAEGMAQKNSVQRLREIGFEPSDYKQAANLSEVANKAYSDAVSASKAKADLPSVYDLADDIADELNMTADQKATLKKDITNRLDAARLADGKGLATFDAQGLEQVADALGKKAKKLTTTSEGGSKADNGTLSPDDDKYARALTEIKKALRGEVNDMVGSVDLNKEVAAKLKAAGATDNQVKYLTQDGNLSGLKARTSLLEDARTMDRQMRSDRLKRGANATNSISLGTQIANATGASGLLDIATTPVRKVVGRVEKLAGNAVGAVGDMAAGDKAVKVSNTVKNIASKVGGAIDAVNTPLASGNWQSGDTFAQAMRNARLLTPSDVAKLPALNRQSLSSALTGANNLINNQNVMTSNIARRAGLAQAGQAEAQRDMQNAQQEMYNAQTDYNNAMAQAQQLYMQAQTPQVSAGQQQLDRIANAMTAALNAGDIDAYSQLANLYNQAYKMYGSEAGANSTASLNATQQANLAKLQSAESAIDKLEQLYNQAGGGQGRLGGTLAEWGAGIGMNSNVSAYNTAARGMINQIAAAVGKTDSLNTEGEVQRALDLVPKITDTPQEAQIKLQSLREMLNANQQTYNNIYGVTQ